MKFVSITAFLIFLGTVQISESQAIWNRLVKPILTAQKVRTVKLVVAAGLVGVSAKSSKVTLRNGTTAWPERVEEVWKWTQEPENKAVHSDYFWVWRTCLACREINAAQCDIQKLDHQALYLKKWDADSIAKLDAKKITRNGMIDEETQNIVISSRSGTGDGKIVHHHHPVKRWYEHILSYGQLPWYIKK